MPGPFQLPPLPILPFYIHPVLLWGIILIAAVFISVTFFRFIFAEAGERVNSFFVFFLAMLFILGLYVITINAPEISALFRRLTAPIFNW